MIFSVIIVKNMKNNLVIAKIFCHSFGPSLFGGPTVAVFRFNRGDNDFAREIENIIICLRIDVSYSPRRSWKRSLIAFVACVCN